MRYLSEQERQELTALMPKRRSGDGLLSFSPPLVASVREEILHWLSAYHDAEEKTREEMESIAASLAHHQARLGRKMPPVAMPLARLIELLPSMVKLLDEAAATLSPGDSEDAERAQARRDFLLPIPKLAQEVQAHFEAVARESYSLIVSRWTPLVSLLAPLAQLRDEVFQAPSPEHAGRYLEAAEITLRNPFYAKVFEERGDAPYERLLAAVHSHSVDVETLLVLTEAELA